MSKPTTTERCKQAYDFWSKNPHSKVDDLVLQFKTNRRSLLEWMKSNNLARPDGKVIGKASPRQQAIKESYEAAIKANETPGWAERYAKKHFDQNTDKGDYRYYAMKNDLPPLREHTPTMQTSPHKINL